MAIEQALTGLLLADAGLAALVGNRVHWVRLPETVKGLPYVNLQVIDDPQSYMKGRTVSGFRQTLVQADAWSDTYAGAADTCAALVAAVSGYRGSVGGVFVSIVEVTGVRDFDASLTGGESQLFRRNVDLKLSWIKEA